MLVEDVDQRERGFEGNNEHVLNTHAEQCTKYKLYKSSDVGQTAFKRRDIIWCKYMDIYTFL